jgi:hypothetical protein
MMIRAMLSFFKLTRTPKESPKRIPATEYNSPRQCCLFSYSNANKAVKKMDFEIVEEYGDVFLDKMGTVVHFLHTWDDGHRTLIRCKKCGALFLRQCSEFHNMCDDSGDSHYTCWFPVACREEALIYNEKYSGLDLEREYSGVWIWRCNNKSTFVNA